MFSCLLCTVMNYHEDYVCMLNFYMMSPTRTTHTYSAAYCFCHVMFNNSCTLRAQKEVIALAEELGMPTNKQYTQGRKILMQADGTLKTYTSSIPPLNTVGLGKMALLLKEVWHSMFCDSVRVGFCLYFCLFLAESRDAVGGYFAYHHCSSGAEQHA